MGNFIRPAGGGKITTNLSPDDLKEGVSVQVFRGSKAIISVTGTWDGFYPYDGPYSLTTVGTQSVSGGSRLIMKKSFCEHDLNYFSLAEDGITLIAKRDFTGSFAISMVHRGSGSEGVKAYAGSRLIGEVSAYSATRHTLTGGFSAKVLQGETVSLQHIQGSYTESLYYFRITAQKT